jgi:hypothetical protein
MSFMEGPLEISAIAPQFRKTEPDLPAFVNGRRTAAGKKRRRHQAMRLPNPGAAAALALYDLVALLQQTLALAILALLLFLDIGTFFTGHCRSPAMISRPCTRSGL